LKDILSKKEFYSFVALILSAIQIFINSPNNVSKEKITNNEVQQITQTVINNSTVQIVNGDNIQINNSTIKKKKIGRNEKCPCGSGLKYKKCCGK